MLQTSVIITGVSSGIGLHAARLLLEKGFHVFGSVRKKEDADLLSRFPDFTPLVFDVTNRAAMETAIREVKESGRRVIALVNNAGIAVSGPLETIAEEDYRKQFEVNVFGNLAMSQLVLPLLHTAREAGEDNVKIINISSVSGYISSPFTSLYSASKFAVEALTDGMRRELMPYGIDVISIAPGPVKTPIWKKGATQTKAFAGTRYSDMVERLGDYTSKAEAGALPPEKIADTIHAAIVTQQPRPDQLVMKKGWLAKLVTLLPKRRADKLIRKNLESNKRY